MKQRLLLVLLALVAYAPSVRAQDLPPGGDAPTIADEYVPSPPLPPPPPPPLLDPAVRTMIDAAIQSGDFEAAKAVIRFARQTSPTGGGEIDKIETAWNAERAANDARAAAEREDRLRAAGVFQNWKGQVEVGGSRATGTTDSFGLYASVDATREGIDWRHKLHAQAEFQRTDGVRTQERLNGSWQPNFKFSKRGYTYGLVQYERDPFAGYENRYTAAVGVGYGLIAGPTIKLDVEGGPGFRHTNSITGSDSDRIVGRGSVNFSWKVTPTLQLVQTGAIYIEHGDNNATVQTALDTKLIGDLKARLSYSIQYEKDPPVGTKALNTQSRATLVYSF